MVLMKNSTVIIAACIILIGIILNGLIDCVFDCKNLKDRIASELVIKKLQTQCP